MSSGTETVRISLAGAESPRDQLFSQLVDVNDFSEVLATFESLRAEIGLSQDDHYEAVYSTLKRELTSWRSQALWQLLDKRAAMAEYEGQTACSGKRVLVVGAGPVGLRAAVEAALLGARVDLVEKRGAFSRNNSLHLWPFVIDDLRNLGAKKFYGKFASGAIDHICTLGHRLLWSWAGLGATRHLCVVSRASTLFLRGGGWLARMHLWDM